MTILLYTLCAAVLVLTGALVSGGLHLPERRGKAAPASPPAEDTLSRDLAALLSYGREEERDDV